MISEVMEEVLAIHLVCWVEKMKLRSIKINKPIIVNIEMFVHGSSSGSDWISSIGNRNSDTDSNTEVPIFSFDR